MMRKEDSGLSMILNIPNVISLLRAPLALLFLVENTTVRIAAVLIAMLTDGIDGYIARKYNKTSSIGAALDPAMDKFFVFFVLVVLFFEHRISLPQVIAMHSRDFFLCVFGLYLRMKGRWKKFQFRAIRWGKITTALQFFVLIALCLGKEVPWPVFGLFVVIGLFAFFELYQTKNESSRVIS